MIQSTEIGLVPLPDYKLDYDHNGWVLIPEFLDEPQMIELQDHLDRYVREMVPQLPSTHAFYQDLSRPETLKQMQFMELDPFFQELPRRNNWRSLAETLVGEPVNPSIEWFNKPPKTHHITPPHQDNYYFCLRPANIATFWLALDAVDDENGCLRYVTGSHRGDIRPHQSTEVIGFSQGITDYGEEDREREAVIRMRPGDLAVHHGNLIHSANANRSQTRHRRAIAAVYKGVSCRLDKEASVRYRAALRAQQTEAGIF